MTIHISARAASIIASALAVCTAPLAAQPPRDSTIAQAPVSEGELRAHIATLSSDAYGGRMPGTAGETLAAHYIAQQLAAAGFIGAETGGSFYQPVPLVEMHLQSFEALWTPQGGTRRVLDEIVLRAPAGGEVTLNAAIIYVGHGVDASGAVIADVRGKVAMMQFENRSGEGALPLSVRRDALVAAGAVGTIIIGSAQAPFAQLAGGFTSARPQLASRVGRGQIEGMVSAATAGTLLESTGLTLAEARDRARADDFSGVMLSGVASLRASTFRRAYNSYNVVARLAGQRAESGTVVLMGHWDHIGTCRPEGAEDRICNGAVDNASGIAVLLAVATRLGAGAPLDRDVMIVATTAEEQGLLGAHHFVAAPLVPLPSIPILLNVDTVAIARRGAPMAMVGRGTTPLDVEVDAVARMLGRAIDSDDEANAFIQRQDGWAFTQAGVPAVMAGGSFADMAALQAFLGSDYHGPNDELTDATPLGGAADDADLHVALTRHFATIASHAATRDD